MSSGEDRFEKAQRLLADNRVYLDRKHSSKTIVFGDTDAYEVWATDTGVVCECYGSTAALPTPRCSHAIAAMVLWKERLDNDAAFRSSTPPADTPFGPPVDGFQAVVEGGVG